VYDVLAAFFQAVSRPFLPMWASLFCCVENVVLGYILMFGKFGLPEMGVNGLALGTVLSQYTQMAILTYWFLTGEIAAKYRTRQAWAFQSKRMLDVLRIGIPGGLTFLFDILNWALFTTQIVGRDGDTVLAGHNAAIGLMHVAIMPAFALNNGIAAIVGQWIGRGRPDIAKQRTYVAIWIAVVYMTLVGFLNAGIGQWFIETVYKAPHDVAVIGQHFLYFAAAFEAFDALFFVTMGALRGAGDTKWTMWATIIGNYAAFMPLAILFAIGFGYGAYGGWAAATIYVMGLSYVVLRRFRGGEWRKISIFSPVATASASPLPEGAAATENAV
jgi:MATE family multidrug resistance protein